MTKQLPDGWHIHLRVRATRHETVIEHSTGQIPPLPVGTRGNRGKCECF